jgi:trk system potassium uptake protein TrkH
MLNKTLVLKVLGILLLIESQLMIVCLVLSFLYREDDFMGFLMSAVITICSSMLFYHLGAKAENSMSRRDAYLIVSLTWVVFSLYGMLPFLISGYITNVSDAFFETMSGFTTTGASVMTHIDKMPHAILFWRSLTHWIGGLGIVFFTIAILPSFVSGDVKLFAAEATGVSHQRIQPRISTTAKRIWAVYLLLTISCAVCLWLAGMGVFDSINHSFSTTSTGGFSTNADSIRGFHSPAIEYIEIVFMFLSGCNFSFLYIALVRGRMKSLLNSGEFKFYLFLVIAASAFIAFELVKYDAYGIEHAIRSALFQVTSIITTTGFYSDECLGWPAAVPPVLLFVMFVGACAGSTAGGLKCVRVVMLIKTVRNEFSHILHPRAVMPVRVDGVTITHSTLATLTAFLCLFLFIMFSSTMVIMLFGYNFQIAFSTTLSCLCNDGPIIGMSSAQAWNIFPDAAMWIFSFLMLIGRLEVFSVLILFTRGFWKDR